MLLNFLFLVCCTNLLLRWFGIRSLSSTPEDRRAMGVNGSSSSSSSYSRDFFLFLLFLRAMVGLRLKNAPTTTTTDRQTYGVLEHFFNKVYRNGDTLLFSKKPKILMEKKNGHTPATVRTASTRRSFWAIGQPNLTSGRKAET